MSEKTMPNWGEIVHIDGEPLVIIGVHFGTHFTVANRCGNSIVFDCEEFDEYKPRTIKINGIEVPAPAREPLKIGQKYWLALVTSGILLNYSWNGNETEYIWLNNGFVHLSEENAQIHIDAVIRANMGERDESAG